MSTYITREEISILSLTDEIQVITLAIHFSRSINTNEKNEIIFAGNSILLNWGSKIVSPVRESIAKVHPQEPLLGCSCSVLSNSSQSQGL